MKPITCIHCGAPHLERIFRQKGGSKWTQDWDVAIQDPSYNPNPTQVRIDLHLELCDKCREAKDGTWQKN